MKKVAMVCLNCIYFAGLKTHSPCRVDSGWMVDDPHSFWCGSGQWRENGEPVFWGDWEEEEVA